MPPERHRDTNPDLAELGANLAGFVGTLAGTAIFLFARGFVVRQLADRLTGSSPHEMRSHGIAHVQSCGSSVVRHHYRICCVPPRHGCPR